MSGRCLRPQTLPSVPNMHKELGGKRERGDDADVIEEKDLRVLHSAGNEPSGGRTCTSACSSKPQELTGTDVSAIHASTLEMEMRKSSSS